MSTKFYDKDLKVWREIIPFEQKNPPKIKCVVVEISNFYFREAMLHTFTS